MTRPAKPGLVIGVGNRWRRDDGAGLEVARLLQAAGPSQIVAVERAGEPAALLHSWEGAGRVLVVDAVRSGAKPGAMHRFDPADGPLPAQLFRSSTHALGVAEAIELARELGRLPAGLAVCGIEGEDFGPGEGLTAEVREAVERLVGELCGEPGEGGPGGGHAPAKARV